MAEGCAMAGGCNCGCTYCKMRRPAHCGRHSNGCHDSCQRAAPGGGDREQKKRPGKRGW